MIEVVALASVSACTSGWSSQKQNQTQILPEMGKNVDEAIEYNCQLRWPTWM